MVAEIILGLMTVAAWTVASYESGKQRGVKVTANEFEPRLTNLERVAATKSEDTERMDWLAYRWTPAGASISQALLSPYGNDLRAAVDAARKQDPRS